MGSSIDGSSFIPSSSPSFERSVPPREETGSALFNETSQFYAWYLSWERSPSEHKETFSLLSTIMQVAKVSLEGGLYLSKESEEEATSHLQTLGDRLMNGSYSTHEISGAIESILSNLTENNPKAKLIAKSTLLQYKMVMHQDAHPGEHLAADYHEAMSRLTAKVTPSLGDLDAEKLSRELTKLINGNASPEVTLENLNEVLNHWP